MTDSHWMPSPDDEPQVPRLPPTPELPEPPKVEFERPKLPGTEPSPAFQRNTRAISLAFSIGFALAGPVILGALVGYWLDARLGTSPTWTMILTLLGMVAGLVQLIRIANKLNQMEDKR
ncbi:MAG: AtpZ/AtpI family protein [Fimbriimonadales bacterium]|nr:AtpZ/AtpI family protein [Fimbriimonadales bacterium]